MKMEILLKAAAYILFIAGSFYFFYGGTKIPEKGRSKGVIMLISIILLSYYYWV
jgi:hypothetical protein